MIWVQSAVKIPWIGSKQWQLSCNKPACIICISHPTQSVPTISHIWYVISDLSYLTVHYHKMLEVWGHQLMFNIELCVLPLIVSIGTFFHHAQCPNFFCCRADPLFLMLPGQWLVVLVSPSHYDNFLRSVSQLDIYPDASWSPPTFAQTRED